MNQHYKSAFVYMFLFGFLFDFLALHLIIVGSVDFIGNNINILISSIVIFLVLASFGLHLFLTRNVDKTLDEKDILYQKNASTYSLMIVAAYILLLSLVLFNVYRETGVISVSFLWFLGYSTFALSYASNSIFLVFQYKKNK